MPRGFPRASQTPIDLLMDALFKMSNDEIELAAEVVRSFQRNKTRPKADPPNGDAQQSLDGVNGGV